MSAEQPNTNPIEQKLEQGWDILKQTTGLGSAIEAGNKVFNAMPEELRGKERKTVVQRSKEISEKLSATIEKKIAEKKLDQNDQLTKQPNEGQAPAPQEQSFFEKIGSGIDKMQNFLAYHLAPMIELIQKIKLPIFGDMQSYVDVFMQFLGMERTMLFGSLRKMKLDPVFNTDNPGKDTEAIEKMVSMAKTVHTYNPEFNVKLFFDESAADFAKQLGPNRKTFRLDELEEFARTNVLEKMITKAKTTPQTNPNANSPQTTPERATETLVKLQQEGNVMSAERNNKTIRFNKEANGAITIAERKWRIVEAGADSGFIVVKDLKPKDGNLEITAGMGIGRFAVGSKKETINQKGIAYLFDEVSKPGMNRIKLYNAQNKNEYDLIPS